MVLLLEHTPVYTVGLRTDLYPESEAQRLRALGADFYRTDRGGLVTFHGPGQLVAYPILDLQSFGKTGKVRWYVGALEKTLIRLCAEFSISAGTSPHTGVWIGMGSVEERKVAALGIHVTRKRVTSHGLALNCNTDMAWFDHIVPCGIEGKGVTSLSGEVGREVKVTDVFEPFARAFAEEFQCELKLAA